LLRADRLTERSADSRMRPLARGATQLSFTSPARDDQMLQLSLFPDESLMADFINR
jgi:hypothetical protein